MKNERCVSTLSLPSCSRYDLMEVFGSTLPYLHSVRLCSIGMSLEFSIHHFLRIFNVFFSGNGNALAKTTRSSRPDVRIDRRISSLMNAAPGPPMHQRRLDLRRRMCHYRSALGESSKMSKMSL